jgi:hypothetical protein
MYHPWTDTFVFALYKHPAIIHDYIMTAVDTYGDDDDDDDDYVV